MRKIVVACYVVCSALLLGLLIYVNFNMSVDETNEREDKGYKTVENVREREIKDDTAPIGIRKEYIFDVPAIKRGGETLAFLNYHQNVQVYIAENLIYERKVNENNLFGKTTGHDWVAVLLYPGDSSNQVRVVGTPVYKSAAESEMTFQIGSKFSIWKNAIWLDFLPDVLSVLAILIGIALIIFILVNFRNTEVNRSLLFMGLFSVCIGVWKFSDTTSAALFFENSLIAAYVPFISLLLAIVPFTMFVRTLFSNRESKAWYAVCFSSIAVTLLTFIAQITGFADMRETLSLNQGVMLVLAIVSIIEVVKEWRKKGLNKDLKLTMYCVLTCVVGLVVDTVIYYATHGIGMKICGIVCFLAYVLVLGVKSILESKELMARGEKAKKFEQMAYHDQLTGLYNRTAYAKDTNKMNDMDNCVAFMMDLNNLKLCNDTKGHDAGDNYIYASAKLIREIFGKYGKCYRMGGDEFCVLTNQLDVFACRSLLDELETNIKKYNEKHPEDFPVHIASGFAEYDKEKDYDFGDTLRRADRLMYKRKMEMKQII